MSWVKKAEDMQQGGSVINVNDIPSHTGCSLGRWYYGIGKGRFGQTQEFMEIEAPHRKFHELLKEYVETYASHGSSGAQPILNQLKTVSLNIIANLDQLKKIV